MQKIYDVSIVGTSDILFSTDTYKENSIQSLERTSRGSGQKRIIKAKVQNDPKMESHFLAIAFTKATCKIASKGVKQ